MRAALTAALAGAVALTAAAPAFAQTAVDKADARCILLLGVVGRDPKNREKATQGVFFYLGKLTAHGQAAKLEPLLAGEAKTPLNQQQAQTELNRCSQELSNSNNQLNGAFRTLSAQQPQRPAGAPPAATGPAIPNPFTAPPPK